MPAIAPDDLALVEQILGKFKALRPLQTLIGGIWGQMRKQNGRQNGVGGVEASLEGTMAL